MAFGLALTFAHLAGDVVPTIIALAGFVLLNAGIATGFLLVVNTRRYSRNQSYYDPDEEDDE